MADAPRTPSQHSADAKNVAQAALGAQRQVQAAMDALVASGTETGLQVAVVLDGRTVVEVTSGTADVHSGSPVTTNTLFFAASTAKGVASSVAHVLCEQGVVDYQTRVADVWPEFGAHGKDRVTLRHVLMHTAGVPAVPPDTTVEDLCDWGHMCEALAGAELWWEPGTRMGYHAQTFGFLLGETLRRVTGRSLAGLLREHLTGPLGVAEDVHFGVPGHSLPRVATQVPGGMPPPAPEPGSPLDRAVPAAVRADAGFANRRDVLTADIPSGGTMTASGAARLYAGLLGHVDGVALVSVERRALMAAPAFIGLDQVMEFPTRWALGYSPDRPGGAAARAGSTFGMAGANGSAAYADIDSGVAVAVMRNRFTPDMTALTTVDRIVAEAFGPHDARNVAAARA